MNKFECPCGVKIETEQTTVFMEVIKDHLDLTHIKEIKNPEKKPSPFPGKG